MNCEQVREHLPAVADGSGPVEAKAHVESCAACQDEVRLHRETWRLMLASPTVKASEGFGRAVRQKVHGRANRILWFIAPLAAAAAIILVALVALKGDAPPPEDPAVAVEREVQKMPEADRVLFNELTADESTWELVEYFDTLRAADLVDPEKLGQESYLLGERK